MVVKASALALSSPVYCHTNTHSENIRAMRKENVNLAESRRRLSLRTVPILKDAGMSAVSNLSAEVLKDSLHSWSLRSPSAALVSGSDSGRFLRNASIESRSGCMSSPFWYEDRRRAMSSMPSRTAGSRSLRLTTVPRTCRETTMSSILRSPGLDRNLDLSLS